MTYWNLLVNDLQMKFQSIEGIIFLSVQIANIGYPTKLFDVIHSVCSSKVQGIGDPLPHKYGVVQV